ncbi:uncharacterized protein LOC128092472 [Culex pipiens pallens]|uniref:uncharacterized protein LOC128092472 n=1 Tax=Culex pipiens pallens TaxID=42434 RepID=UPI0022AA53E0|nr:uncharacterized protein LOC128092472 [Culex pipiens pallens]
MALGWNERDCCWFFARSQVGQVSAIASSIHVHHIRAIIQFLGHNRWRPSFADFGVSLDVHRRASLQCRIAPGTFCTIRGVYFSNEAGTPHLVLRENSLLAGLLPILFGMFLQCSKTYQTSWSVSSAFWINLFAIFTAASALPFACWW